MKELPRIIKVLKERNSFLVTSHIHPDGDSIGASLALACALERMGKRVEIILEDSVPKLYQFLPGAENIRKVSKIDDPPFFEVACVLDCHTEKRIGSVANLVKGADLSITIDHHPDEGGMGRINLVNSSASSACELIFEIIRAFKIEITLELALYLYTGLATDTGFFQFANTTPRTHQIVASLIQAGVVPEQVASKLNETKDISWLKLLSSALGSLRIDEEGEVALVKLKSAAMNRAGRREIETEEIAEILFRARGVKLALLLRELENGKTKLSARSKPPVSAEELCKAFGGGGHPQAAGAILDLGLKEAERAILKEAGRLSSDR